MFAPALGSFLAPDLLGGGKKLLIGSLIQMQFTSSRNWPFGAALSTVVTVVVLTVFVMPLAPGVQEDAAMSGASPSTGGIRPACRPITALIFVFLYAPLLILVIYAFNASRLVTVWAGFSLRLVRARSPTMTTSAAPPSTASSSPSPPPSPRP